MDQPAADRHISYAAGTAAHDGELLFTYRDIFCGYTNNNELQLEKLNVVEIRSISPRNHFFSPLSWQVSFGGRRTDTGHEGVLAPYLDGGAGGSWRIARVF